MRYLTLFILVCLCASFASAIVPSEGEIIPFGNPEYKPYMADYDGDGILDAAVYDPATGIWYIQKSTTGYDAIWWGVPGVIPVPADYDGDGKTDLAVYYEDTLTWYINGSQDGMITIPWGYPGCIPTPDDYDNDGKADAGYYLPMNGHWYLSKARSSLDENLIAHLPFSGNADDVVNGYDGTVFGATLTEDRFGNADSAYYFDGDSHIDLGNVLNVGSTSHESLSVCTWIKTTNMLSSEALIIGKIQSTHPWTGWGLFIHYNKGISDLVGNGTSENTQVYGTNQLSDGNWHFVCATFSSSENYRMTALYVDGEPEGKTEIEAPHESTESSFPLWIGSRPPENNFRYTGAIDDIRIYDGILSDAQVQALYNSLK